jgi:hypothetical protein
MDRHTIRLIILSCIRRLYETGSGLTTGFIGLNYTTRDYTLQFTVRHMHTNLLSPGVFSLVVTSQLSHNSSGPRTSCRPPHCLRAHWLTAIPLPQPGLSIHLLACTHWPPNQDCNSGGPVHCFLVTVFQYRRFLSFRIRWHIYPKMVTLEGPFTLTTATLLCRQSSSLLYYCTATNSSPGYKAWEQTL